MEYKKFQNFFTSKNYIHHMSLSLDFLENNRTPRNGPKFFCYPPQVRYPKFIQFREICSLFLVYESSFGRILKRIGRKRKNFGRDFHFR